MKPLRSMFIQLLYGNSGTLVIRIILGSIFILAGISKIVDPVRFFHSVVAYAIVSEELAAYIAIIVPTLELVLGVLLIIGYKIKSAVFTMLCLMMAFSVFILINIFRGKSFQCGCFNLPVIGSFIDGRIGLKLLVRNVIISGLLFLVFFVKNNLFSIDTFIEKLKLKNL